MHTPSDAYLKRLSPLLSPCRIHSLKFLEVGHWLITAKDDSNLHACCNVCERLGTRFDHVWRKVRHLNFGSKQVFILLQLPRIRCEEHGVRNAHQRIFDNHSKYSPAFQEFVHREFFSDQQHDSLARRMMIPTTTMMRIVQNLTSRKLAAHFHTVEGIQVYKDGLDR
jgi:transposase